MPTLCIICRKVRPAVFIEFPVLSGVYLILLASVSEAIVYVAA